ncbi:(2Fe-2S)-binding protein [Gordoniibacillus kamchatkensis]|uniref:(2Fe-2S)-binding protein n=1 Tax=Gordoniibacillus kamchatkensis TaxID=1590651 RepID=A0ABR5AMD1_9BACL|nr:Rieske (2Fe-2S) protein [Paenibacillus sp. VKM B-2647]KIL42193.1 (2Fe-2S)-binding protein [Paenibacillus sp. VKM B-2647]
MGEWIHAGTLEALKAERSKVVKGGIAVFYHEDRVFAVDNRCPHLGFPLHLGTVCDGMLTCHWHHARFDVGSGGTLDPWADDVPAYDVRIDDGGVWVSPVPRQTDNTGRLKARLRQGLEQNIGIVIAKAVVGLVEAGVPADDIVRVGIAFGTGQGTGWGAGLTILTAMRNVLPKLDRTGQILALYHGLVHVARASAGRAPRHLLGPLPQNGAGVERLMAWYRNCAEVRDTQGAEKVLLTAVESGVSAERLADMMLVAVTDHFYLDGGHTFDFHNKAFEALETMGADFTKPVLASLVPLLGDPTRSEELHHWQAPVDLVTPLRQAFERLQAGSGAAREGVPELDEDALLEQLLSDRPVDTVEKLTELLLSGIAPSRIAQLIALAAAERVARFHTQNDFGDWVAVLHTFTYAHAVHERLLRSQEPLLNRALFYGAAAVYHDRFLNVPRAPAPKPKASATDGDYRLEELLELTDRRQQVDEAAGWVADYVRAGQDCDALLNTLGHCLLREDAEFHTFQMYEAAVKQFERWRERSDSFAERAKETLLVACARYLAAHAPTARELPHTARIAWRLYRGERLFDEEERS